ncbi:MAG TPA: hypothetical protein VJ506_12305 [Candidatus Limnocylindrales bacterium]|nr:hypothetical protein [Candidatus Limnocylindrales bacterium]
MSWIGLGNDRDHVVELAVDDERRRAEAQFADSHRHVSLEDLEARRALDARRPRGIGAIVGRLRCALHR